MSTKYWSQNVWIWFLSNVNRVYYWLKSCILVMVDDLRITGKNSLSPDTLRFVPKQGIINPEMLRIWDITICFAYRIIPLTLQISFHSFSASVINSTIKFQSQMTFRLCTTFLKLGSHYSTPSNSVPHLLHLFPTRLIFTTLKP